MTPSPESSLTGSSRGAPATHSASVSLALGRLRFSVLLSCWVIGLALLAQTLIWGLTTFTQVRWDRSATAPPEAAMVVQSGPAAATVRSALDDVEVETGNEPVDANRIVTGYDRVFDIGSRLSRGLGTLGVLALLPLLAVGVLLAAASATRGVDKTVSAFTWSVVVAMLALPLGQLLGMSESGGAFWSYEHLTNQVDATALSAGDVVKIDESQLVSLARYLLLPLASLCAVGMVGLRFGAGVEAGLMKKEDFALDAELEVEAGNITPSSLHGGRAAAAMQAVGTAVPFGAGAKAVAAPADGPASIRQVPAGDAPKRMI